jgi:hypothetical protein
MLWPHSNYTSTASSLGTGKKYCNGHMDVSAEGVVGGDGLLAQAPGKLTIALMTPVSGFIHSCRAAPHRVRPWCPRPGKQHVTHTLSLLSIRSLFISTSVLDGAHHEIGGEVLQDSLVRDPRLRVHLARLRVQKKMGQGSENRCMVGVCGGVRARAARGAWMQSIHLVKSSARAFRLPMMVISREWKSGLL